MSNNEFMQIIRDTIQNNDVVLYMKGEQESPMCGFSATVVNILNLLDVPFTDINVLSDPNIRESIKEFSDWPTIPQLYVKGEFIGGCDIVREMYESGELQKLLKNNNLI